mgnify:CR=1 FL=1
MAEALSASPPNKVLDFGIAKVTEAENNVRLTSTGTGMGSPQYMSPEQVRDAGKVDARADVWALGVTLFELLSDQAPFSGTTYSALCAQIIADEPLPLRKLRPDAPEAVGRTMELVDGSTFSFDDLRYTFSEEELPPGMTRTEFLRPEDEGLAPRRIQYSKVEVISALLRRGALVEAPPAAGEACEAAASLATPLGQGPLHLACADGNLAAASRLLEHLALQRALLEIRREERRQHRLVGLGEVPFEPVAEVDQAQRGPVAADERRAQPSPPRRPALRRGAPRGVRDVGNCGAQVRVQHCHAKAGDRSVCVTLTVPK